MLTLKEFKEARGVLSGVIRNTSLVYSPAFSKATGNQIYIKPENMQVTGAYKIRGAYYKISTLSDEEKARGLVTASAGNHAQGVAYAAQAAGVSATIVMPTTTPLVKVNNTKDYGAKVVLHGETFDDAAELAAKLSEEEGLTYVHPFNDPAIATGQGTISYEIFQDLPDVDVILVPIGGGGLATGVSTLAKLLNPNVTVIGVEPSGAASMKASLEAGHVVTLDRVETIADGVAVKTPGDQIFPYIQKNIDDIITIPDDELVDAFLDMMEKHKMIVENAGLLTIAALRAGKHVLCEKPMATTLADCEAMAAAARESGKFLMIGQNQRLTKAHQKARQLVADGVLGDILTFRTTFGHGGPETWSVDPGKNTWFFDKSKAAMGAMADLGIHKTDLIQYLLGQTVVEATAKVTTLEAGGRRAAHRRGRQRHLHLPHERRRHRHHDRQLDLLRRGGQLHRALRHKGHPAHLRRPGLLPQAHHRRRGEGALRAGGHPDQRQPDRLRRHRLLHGLPDRQHAPRHLRRVGAHRHAGRVCLSGVLPDRQGGVRRPGLTKGVFTI